MDELDASTKKPVTLALVVGDFDKNVSMVKLLSKKVIKVNVEPRKR